LSRHGDCNANGILGTSLRPDRCKCRGVSLLLPLHLRGREHGGARRFLRRGVRVRYRQARRARDAARRTSCGVQHRRSAERRGRPPSRCPALRFPARDLRPTITHAGKTVGCAIKRHAATSIHCAYRRRRRAFRNWDLRNSGERQLYEGRLVIGRKARSRMRDAPPSIERSSAEHAASAGEHSQCADEHSHVADDAHQCATRPDRRSAEPHRSSAAHASEVSRAASRVGNADPAVPLTNTGRPSRSTGAPWTSSKIFDGEHRRAGELHHSSWTSTIAFC
jgi:hypothetical protein